MMMALTESLQFLLDEATAEQNVPGGVLYVATPEGKYEIASGFSYVTKRHKVQRRDRFRIGAITQVFVATVVLQLYQNRALNLEDNLTKWLEQEICDRLENSDKITIRQLLNHSSGLDDYLETDEFQQAVSQRDKNQFFTAKEAICLVDNLESLGVPGAGHCYSNTNYILLELIVEAVTGNPLYQEMRSRIFDPLGLKDTFTEYRETPPPKHKSCQNCISPEKLGTGLGDRGLISSAYDVGKFAETLFMTDELLNEDTFDQMIHWFQDNEGGFYGLGVNSWDAKEWGDVWGYTGGIDGYSSALWHLPDEEMTIVVLLDEDINTTPDYIIERVLAVILEDEL
ncbi:MAG: class A beta-lactamase-related serine hydrolase [Arthrospira sp. PLM2.Bin9]|nr:serine hydrolase domain-containing protein [Arthrospira sp. PLM2.Bin9]TVU54307.1 MAG: class A beta-lactamase-related serine hydrolase [Arthrospira sp. PLM2.Bin9]